MPAIQTDPWRGLPPESTRDRRRRAAAEWLRDLPSSAAAGSGEARRLVVRGAYSIDLRQRLAQAGWQRATRPAVAPRTSRRSSRLRSMGPGSRAEPRAASTRSSKQTAELAAAVWQRGQAAASTLRRSVGEIDGSTISALSAAWRECAESIVRAFASLTAGFLRSAARASRWLLEFLWHSLTWAVGVSGKAVVSVSLGIARWTARGTRAAGAASAAAGNCARTRAALAGSVLRAGAFAVSENVAETLPRWKRTVGMAFRRMGSAARMQAHRAADLAWRCATVPPKAFGRGTMAASRALAATTARAGRATVLAARQTGHGIMAFPGAAARGVAGHMPQTESLARAGRGLLAAAGGVVTALLFAILAVLIVVVSIIVGAAITVR